MLFVSEIEAMPVASFLQWGGVIDEKHGVFDVVFLAEFAEKDLCESVCSGRFELCVEEFVRLGIDSGVQPYCSLLSWITVSSTAT